jgi:hypothetical protein
VCGCGTREREREREGRFLVFGFGEVREVLGCGQLRRDGSHRELYISTEAV